MPEDIHDAIEAVYDEIIAKENGLYAALLTKFHSQAGIARAFKISNAAVCNWKGKVPPSRRFAATELLADRPLPAPTQDAVPPSAEVVGPPSSEGLCEWPDL